MGGGIRRFDAFSGESKDRAQTAGRSRKPRGRDESDRIQVASMSERPPISPRSPRAALEPEQVPPPPRRSERARNPFVVIGNAIITIVLVLMIGSRLIYYFCRRTIPSACPSHSDNSVY